jgi:hypothetical protein
LFVPLEPGTFLSAAIGIAFLVVNSSFTGLVLGAFIWGVALL